MARGAVNQANKTFGESQNAYANSSGNSSQLYQQLFPILQGEATNPQGFSPADLAARNTASQQSVGGSTAGAVGEGGLQAARTRNAGGFAPALDEAARTGTRQLSENALATQTANSDLKEKQRQEGIGGLTGLYDTNTQKLLAALGLSNQSADAAAKAGQSGWFQNLLGLGNMGANIFKSLKPKGV